MKTIRNEKGITLIEVLAVFVIVSILMIILFNIFSSGISFSKSESTKVTMQQQSNYILTVWREYHEDGYPYSVTLSNDSKTITFEQYSHADLNEVLKSQVIQDSNYTFNVELLSGGQLEKIIPAQTKTISIKVTIYDEKGHRSPYRIETKLSRL